MDFYSDLLESRTSEQQFYVHTCEDLCKVVLDYEFNTVRKFIVQKVDKEFGSKGQFFTVFISRLVSI